MTADDLLIGMVLHKDIPLCSNFSTDTEEMVWQMLQNVPVCPVLKLIMEGEILSISVCTCHITDTQWTFLVFQFTKFNIVKPLFLGFGNRQHWKSFCDVIHMYKPESHADYSYSLAVNMMQPVSTSANIKRWQCIDVFLTFMFSVSMLRLTVQNHLMMFVFSL